MNKVNKLYVLTKKMLSFKRTFEILDAFGVEGELLETTKEYIHFLENDRLIEIVTKQFKYYLPRGSLELEEKTDIELSIDMCDAFLSRFIVHGLQPVTLTNNSNHDIMTQEEVDVLFEKMTLEVGGA